MTCDIPTLLRQACANGFDLVAEDTVLTRGIILQLLCNFSDSGGGSVGTGATFGDYGGSTPTFTPASGSGLAIDTSNHTFWEYDNGAWHNLV